MGKTTLRKLDNIWVHSIYYSLLALSTLTIILTQIPGIGGILRTFMSSNIVDKLKMYKPGLVVPLH